MSVIRYILGFLLLTFLQIAIFNQFLFFGYMNPYLYIFFIIMLSPSFPKPALLLIAFFMGLVIDIFENSAGVHAAASTLLAYSRPALLRLLTTKTDKSESSGKIYDAGFLSLLGYSFACIFLHHFVLFLIESFNLTEIGVILIRSLYSSLFTFIFVLFIHLWNFPRLRLK